MSFIKDLFRESPFEPLRHHMATVMECVGYVRPMFEAVREERFDTLHELAKQAGIDLPQILGTVSTDTADKKPRPTAAKTTTAAPPPPPPKPRPPAPTTGTRNV